MSFESKPKFDIMPANESTDFSTVAYSGLRPNRPQQPLLILLSGATCGGKSTLADRLQQIWPHSQRIGQDDFFREEDDPEHVWLTLSDGKRHQDWEHVRSIDWNKMRQVAHDRLQLARSKLDEQKESDIPAILILEGHLVLSQNWDELSQRQIRFFFTIDRNSCFERRNQRTYVPLDPPTYFDDHVWPEYEQNERQVRQSGLSVHFLDGTCDPNELYDFVEKQVRACF